MAKKKAKQIKNWYRTDKKLNANCLIKIDLFDETDRYNNFTSFQKQITNLDILKCLKYFKISQQSEKIAYLVLDLLLYLNKWTMLTHLEIDLDLIDNNISVLHPNLTTLSIGYFDVFDEEQLLDIDCLKLKCLKLNGYFSLTTISNPETLDHLFVSSFKHKICVKKTKKSEIDLSSLINLGQFHTDDEFIYNHLRPKKILCA